MKKVGVSLFLLVLLMCVGAVSAADLYVDLDGQADGIGCGSLTVAYSTIQAAATAANIGDTISVCPGTYNEQVVINKALTLQGSGVSTAVKPSSDSILTTILDGNWFGSGTKQIAGIIMANVADGSAVIIKNLKVDGSNVIAKPAGADYIAGIFYRETSGIIDSIAAVDMTVGATGTAVRGYGIYLSAVTNTVSTEVKDSTLTNYDKNGIDAHGNKLTANIHHNTIIGRGPLPNGDEVQNGILIMNDAFGIVNNNSVSDNAYIPATWVATGIVFYNAGGSAQENNLTNDQTGIAAQIVSAGSWTVSLVKNRVNASGLSVPAISGLNGATYDAGASLTMTMDQNQITEGLGDGIYIGDIPANSPAGSVAAIITNNIISGWNHGINLVSSVASSTISGNTIKNNLGLGSGIHIEPAVTVTNIHVNYNSIINNIGTGIFGISNLGSGTLDAEKNWWGTACSSGIAANVSGLIDFDPYYVNVGKTILSDEAPPAVYVDDDYSDGNAGSHYFCYDAFNKVQDGVNAVAANGFVQVFDGIYIETGQIVINKDLTIKGNSKPVIKPSADTGTSGDSRGWFLVNSGITFNLKNVILDGSGYKIWQGIRQKGKGSITNVDFKNIQFEASGPSYAGTAVAVFGTGNVDIQGCTFVDIGRVGVLFYGSTITNSVYKENTYTGKGLGDWLDYGVEVGAGAVATITLSEILDNKGVASVDSSTSAGILVTDYYGTGTSATILNNNVHDNYMGIAIGYDGSDTSSVVAHYNKIVDNDIGADSTAPLVDAENNWWGSCNGPYHSTNTMGDGNPVTDYVDFKPWTDAGCPQVDKNNALALLNPAVTKMCATKDYAGCMLLKAAKSNVEKSLLPSYWFGKQNITNSIVFDLEGKAVGTCVLMKKAVASCPEVITLLAHADWYLADVALKEAMKKTVAKPENKICYDRSINAAKSALAAAAKVLLISPTLAIQYYKASWLASQNAIKFAAALNNICTKQICRGYGISKKCYDSYTVI